jgi:hypothetical protein
MLALLLFTNFCSCHRTTKANMDLEPTDKRPVYHTTVGDADEAQILQQELLIEPQNVAMPDLWFYVKDEGTLTKMRDLGYEISKSDLKQVYSKVVKSEPLTDEQTKEFKIQLLNREKDHFVIRGTLEQLSALQNKGIQLMPLDYEPRPREVKVIVSRTEDVQKASEAGLDIYSTETGKEREIVIYGGAFDYAVDAMKKLNFNVSIIK